ncbi:MAG: GNAT family N-acetyltransferase [Cellulosilyticaceae bacterium]
MKKTLVVTTKEGTLTPLELITLDTSYLSQIMAFQDRILSALPDSTWFASTSEEEFKECIESTGCILGYVTPDHELAALGVYNAYGMNKHNYGYDLELDSNLLSSVGHVECTIVEENFRGNRLQDILCDAIEEIGLKKGTPLMCATVHPDNKYSLQTFIKRGYEVKKEKLKYGGLRRYILLKPSL